MMRPFPDDLTPHDFLDAASLPGRRGPSDGGRVLRFSPDAMAALERRAEEARDTLAKLDAEDAAAGYAPVSVGDVVAYDCPTWGPSRGRVLAVVDSVLGEGTYDRLASDLYDAIRARAAR